jgi:hypothetical protein
MQRRIPRLFAGSLAACLPALGLLVAFGPAAGACGVPEFGQST